MEDPKKNNKEKRAYMEALSLGTELVGPIIMGGLGGYWLDKSKNTGTTWTLILLALGIIIGIYNFIKIVRKLNK
ncbi:MAG: hypothetical protein A2X64_05985 [Ignavibacteria bacterium GWF2_33_9]|nr:MAG: hypothetical protein A2X64_05985 [Ignavibacteria bacterium GWF2_33_9]